MKKRINNDSLRERFSQNRGSTMVETLVAFVVLMIILALITGIIMFCSKLRMRAEETSRAMTEFTAQINNVENETDISTEEGSVESGVAKVTTNTANNLKITRYRTGKQVTKGEDGRITSSKPVPLFYLVTPESDTDESDENYQKDYLSLYNIETDSYAYISGDENLQYLLPKALRFVHKEDR